MSGTYYKMMTTYYDPSPELDMLAKEGWKAVSHSTCFNPKHDDYFHTILLVKEVPYINRMPG